MDELQNMLSQKIGIFYKDQVWKRKVFDKIVEYYRSLDMIDFHIYNSWDARIVLTDKTEILFVEANEKCRGHKFSKVIIQPGVDQLIIDNIIRPCILPFINGKYYITDILQEYNINKGEIS